MKRALIVDLKGFSVVYCNAYCSDKSNTQKSEITTKTIFAATVGPADMPLVVPSVTAGAVTCNAQLSVY